MIDLTRHTKRRKKTIQRVYEKGIKIPTFAEMKDPKLIPESVKNKLENRGLWEIAPDNLYRITWKNAPVKQGGLYGGVNYLELPPALTGVPARIIGLLGKWFPTGSHKVGATFGCLIPRLITGQFDPTNQKAAWPSTGNYCRGGAYNCQLLACESVAILPEEMSRERFQWLSKVAGEVITTPGSESNVKEIFDKCKELKRERDSVVIFNQFDELGNYLWHYEVTGSAMEEVLQDRLQKGDRLAGLVLTTGSSGTIAAGDYLKGSYPRCRIVAGEALQCPTLLYNGFGAHRIEGIGDKHVPWIHNVKNTDFIVGIDDIPTMGIIRLFNEEKGRMRLEEEGVCPSLIERLPELGISSVANMIGAIKLARYQNLTQKDVILTVFTDSMELYGSRLEEMKETMGPYTEREALIDYYQHLRGLTIDHVLELGYYDRWRIHNLKYYTWIEQQDKDLAELNAQWDDAENYWGKIPQKAREMDDLIKAFNEEVEAIRRREENDGE